MQKDLNTYIEHTAEIRQLSSPQLTGIKNATEYGEVLKEHFKEIGEYGRENRRILEESVFPYLDEEMTLDEEQMEVLGEFGDSLLDAFNLDNLDPALYVLLSGKLLQEAEGKGSVDILIEQLDREVSSNYTLVNQVGRMFPDPNLAEQYRKKGFAAGRKLLSFMEEGKFESLSRKSKELVLINSRYMWALYEKATLTEEECRENYERLKWALQIASDPYYTGQMPDYNWKNHIFRTYQYIGTSIEHHNYRSFPKDIMDKICEDMEDMEELWDSDREFYEQLAKECEIRLMLLNARFFSGRIRSDEYMDELLELYENREDEDYEFAGMLMSLNVPAEWLMTVDLEHVTEEQLYQVGTFYHDMLNYMFRIPNRSSLSYMLEYAAMDLETFIEIPGEMTFEDMGLNIMAALHPPTYVHSMMVGQIAYCLCNHALKRKPKLFAELKKIYSDEEILDFAYHGALCHDFGKVLMIDTILIYGRKLFDMEFELIKHHPMLGAELLKRYDSTKKYQNIALGHHCWYDGTKGYPDDFSSKNLPEKTIIDIVTIADCLDAATDNVGRSYSTGKTVEEVVEEFRQDSGTRYSPDIVELFSDEEVRKDLGFLLKEGRKENYKNTYLLLRDLQIRGEYT